MSLQHWSSRYARLGLALACILGSPRPVGAAVDLAPLYRQTVHIALANVDMEELFGVLARASGLQFVFDAEVDRHQAASLFIDGTAEQALHALLLSNGLQQQPLVDNTVLIFPNVAEKKALYQETLVKAYYLHNADAGHVAERLKNALQLQAIIADEPRGMLIARADAATMLQLDQLIALLDMRAAEVELDITIMAVQRQQLRQLGLTWPDSAGLSLLPLGASAAPTLQALLAADRAARIGVELPAGQLIARQRETATHLVAQPRLRMRHLEPARLVLGERLPSLSATQTSTGFVSQTVSYLDTGLTLELEAAVSPEKAIRLKLKLDLSSVTGQSQSAAGTLAYQLGSQAASTVVTLQDGAPQVVAGLLRHARHEREAGMPGLSAIPGVGRLFGAPAPAEEMSELVFVVTPHVIRHLQRPTLAQSEYAGGTANGLRARPTSRTPPELPLPEPSGLPLPPAPRQAKTNAAPLQLSWQGPHSVAPGEPFSLALRLSPSGPPMLGYSMLLSYDADMLELLKVEDGAPWPSGDAAGFSASTNSPGQIQIMASREAHGVATADDAAPDATPSVDSVMVKLHFQARRPGSAAAIEVTHFAPRGRNGAALVARLPPGHRIEERKDAQ